MTKIILILGLHVFAVLAELHCNGGDSCCDSKPNGCLVGEGDCDIDSHCAGNLVCGEDNCVGISFDRSDDCCYQPCIPGGLCPTEPVEGIVKFALKQLSGNCNQSEWAVVNFQTQVVNGYLYYFDLELPESPGCDFESGTKVCHVVVAQPVDSGPSELTIDWDQTNCTVVKIDDTGDCEAIKDAYDLIAMAAAAKGCDLTRTGDHVISLQTCSDIACTADLIGKSSSCKKPSDSGGDCKALEKMAKGLLNAKKKCERVWPTARCMIYGYVGYGGGYGDDNDDGYGSYYRR